MKTWKSKSKGTTKQLINQVETDAWYSQAKSTMMDKELEQLTEDLFRSNQRLIDRYQEMARAW